MSTETPLPEISIVMATCSRAEWLRDAMVSLFAQSLLQSVRAEFVVVDDLSTDNTPETLEQLKAASPVPFTILRGAGQGVAAARNLAASAARGTWLASFDDDQLAPADWLASLYGVAQKHGAVCVGGSIRLLLPSPDLLPTVGPRARRLLGECSASGADRPMTATELPATGNVLMRREVFESLGGFNEQFRQGGEDTDLFQRMHRAGHAIWFAPAAEALHRTPQRRLERGALVQTALRTGAIEARLAAANRRWMPLLTNIGKRLALALCRDLPRMALAKIQKDRTAGLDARLSLAVTEGLLRAVPALRGGNSQFLQSIDFRSRNGERAVVPAASNKS